MKRRMVFMVVLALIAIGTFTVSGQPLDKPRRGFLSVLKEGQAVTIKEIAGRYEITVMDDVPLGHKLVEVGADYLTIQDIAGITETRIPTYSVKSIVRVKLPRR